MGIQVEFVQSPEDEAALVELLCSKAELLAIPRILDAPKVRPQPLGACTSTEQLVILAGDRDHIARTVEPIIDVYTHAPKPGEFGISVAACRGMFLEWSRSPSPAPNELASGRMFFNTKPPASEASARELKRLFAATKRLVAKYPLRTDARYPVYVGPHAADGLAQGRYRCVWRAGVDMELIANVGAKR